MSQPTNFRVLQVIPVTPLEETTPLHIPTSLTLTFFDLLWLRFPPVERLFIYEFPNPTTSFFDSVLPNLKHSLTLTLQHFLPFAGNITWPLDSPYPIIKYVPGDAISFTIAESNANFNHLCSDVCEAVERYPLIPHLTTSHDQASVLALQVTVFPNYGFCIGITTHHAAMDGKSSTLFMKAWAYACSKLRESPSLSLPEHLLPFYDRSVIKDPRGIGAVYINDWLKKGGPNNRSLKVWESVLTTETERTRGSFELIPSHIQRLKQYAQSKLKMKVHSSTFSVTCAYVLACLVKVEQPKTNKVAFAFSVDCRSRLDPPIQPNYFGNCVTVHLAVAETNKFLENDGFVCALEGISESLNRLLKEGVLSGTETLVSMMESAAQDRTFSTAGSPLFEVYSIDFGWGKPKKVDMTSIDRTGAFSLSESRNYNGGIEIGLVLNKREMEAFSALFVQVVESF